MPEDLLFTDAAAELLKLSSSTLEKQRVAGTGPQFLRIGGRRVAYRRSDIDAWLETRVRTSTSDPRDRRRTKESA